MSTSEPREIEHGQATSQPNEVPIGMDNFAFVQSTRNQVCTSFEGMRLKPNLLCGIYACGFKNPTALQRRAIIPCLTGRDLIGEAPPGTGKTVMFSIAILQQLAPDVSHCQAVILAPTRERAQEIEKAVQALGVDLNVTCYACSGGTVVRQDQRKLEAGVQVVVGTPGRVYDMVNRGFLKTPDIKMLVFDEADEILSRGFVHLIEKIFKTLNEGTQLILLSVTIPPELLNFATKLMRDPVTLRIKQRGLALEEIKQFYVNVEKEEWKLDTLSDLCRTPSTEVVVFCNTGEKVNWLMESMREKQHTVAAVEGNIDQNFRENINEFCTSSFRVLITTDKTGLCMDAQKVSAFINYDMPTNLYVYDQRIGQADKFSGKCVVINFVTDEDHITLKDIEEFYDTNIIEVPSGVADLFY